MKCIICKHNVQSWIGAYSCPFCGEETYPPPIRPGDVPKPRAPRRQTGSIVKRKRVKKKRAK